MRYPNVYGIDMPAAKELVAHGKTDEEVAQAIGTDRLIYQDLADLMVTVSRGNRVLERFDASVFDGEYVTGDVSHSYLQQLGESRSDEAKSRRGTQDSDVIELHNAS